MLRVRFIAVLVAVPPDEPHISDEDGNELRGLIGPYNEGQELRLYCTSAGGKPRPALTWWRDYTTIDDTFDYNDKDGESAFSKLAWLDPHECRVTVTTNELVIPSLQRHHLLSQFQCQAVNNNITLPATSSITLDLNREFFPLSLPPSPLIHLRAVKPQEVHITQLTANLAAEREATFECNTFGSRPRATLYWLFDGSRHNTPLSGEHHTTSTLTVKLKEAQNGMLVTCVAENSRIAKSAISDQLRLDVQCKSLAILSLTMTAHGASVKQTCRD